VLDLLKSAQARRVLAVVTGISAVTLLAIQYVTVVLIDEKHDFLQAALLTVQLVATGLFGGVGAAAFIAFVTRYLFKHERKLEQVEIIDALTSHHSHLHAIEVTDNWYHNGHIGRWVRTEVLPRFKEAARGGASKTVKFIVIDPSNEPLVAAYAEHRDQVDAIPDGLDTKLDARVEIFATIIRAAVYQQHVPGVEVEVYLRQDLDLFRVDTSDERAFTTLTRVRTPALLFHHDPEDGDHYNAAKRNFEKARVMAQKVDVDSTVIARDPGVEDIADFLTNTGFAQFAAMADDVWKRAQSNYNRTR